MKTRECIPMIGLFFLLLTLIGCDVTGPDELRFTARVDSVSVPETIAPSDSLEVRLFGSLPNPCYRVEGVEIQKTEGTVKLRARGIQNISEGINCPDVEREWDQLVVVSPPFQNPLLVEIDQGDGTSMDRVVTVQ